MPARDGLGLIVVAVVPDLAERMRKTQMDKALKKKRPAGDGPER